jgi:surface polysaccharide O-acyltransferase-like enzyme
VWGEKKKVVVSKYNQKAFNNIQMNDSMASVGKKLLFVNNLRIVLIALIVMLHISITYGGAGSWYYNEKTDETLAIVVLTIFNAVVQSFALGFFFLISAFFAPTSYLRKGPKLYLKGRLLRLGIPILVYFFILNPFIVYFLYVRSFGYAIPLNDYFGTGPLWFVQTLLIFSIGYILWRMVVTEKRAEFRPPPGDKQILTFILILSFANFIIRILWPTGKAFSNLQFGYFPGYIGLFAAGIMAQKNGWFNSFREEIGRKWLKLAIMGIPLFPVIAILGGALEDITPFEGGFHWQSLAYSTWDAFEGVALIAGLFVFFRKHFDFQNPLMKQMAENVYTVFIIHGPVIVFLAFILRDLDIYPLLKFTLVSVIGVSLCFLISHYVLRRIPYSDRVL